jgi:hypothetical protein
VITVSAVTIVVFAIVLVVCTAGGVWYAQRKATRDATGEIRQGIQKHLSTYRMKRRGRSVKDENEDEDEDKPE